MANHRGKDWARSPQVSFNRVVARGEDFSGRTERDWISVESTFEDCKFENLRITDFSFGAGLKPSLYRFCSFDGSHIKSVIPGRATFENCSFQNVRMTKWICHAVEMIDCVFQGRLDDLVLDARVRPDVANGLGRTINRYHGNDFSAAELCMVSFRGGIDLADQRLPRNENYLYLDNAKQVIPIALRQISGWPESDLKERLQDELYMVMNDVSGGQRQVLLSRYDLASKSDPDNGAWKRMVEVIAGAVEHARQESSESIDIVTDRVTSRRAMGGFFAYMRATDALAARLAVGRSLGVGAGKDPSTVPGAVAAQGVDHFFALGHLVALIRRTRWSSDIVPCTVVWPPTGGRPANLEDYERLPEDAPWKTAKFSIMELGTDVRNALADVDDSRLLSLAGAWAGVGEFAKFSDSTAAGLLPVVTDLVKLAREARRRNEFLYCVAL